MVLTNPSHLCVLLGKACERVLVCVASATIQPGCCRMKGITSMAIMSVCVTRHGNKEHGILERVHHRALH